MSGRKGSITVGESQWVNINVNPYKLLNVKLKAADRPTRSRKMEDGQGKRENTRQGG